MPNFSQESSEPETQFVEQDDDDVNLWDALAILAERPKEFKIKWAGTDPSNGKPWSDSWVPKRDVTTDLVEEWRLTHPKSASTKSRRSKIATKTAATSTSSKPRKSTPASRASSRTTKSKSHSPAKTSTARPKPRPSSKLRNGDPSPDYDVYDEPPTAGPSRLTAKRKHSPTISDDELERDVSAYDAGATLLPSSASRPSKKRKVANPLGPSISDDEDMPPPSRKADKGKARAEESDDDDVEETRTPSKKSSSAKGRHFDAVVIQTPSKQRSSNSLTKSSSRRIIIESIMLAAEEPSTPHSPGLKPGPSFSSGHLTIEPDKRKTKPADTKRAATTSEEPEIIADRTSQLARKTQPVKRVPDDTDDQDIIPGDIVRRKVVPQKDPPSKKPPSKTAQTKQPAAPRKRVKQLPQKVAQIEESAGPFEGVGETNDVLTLKNHEPTKSHSRDASVQQPDLGFVGVDNPLVEDGQREPSNPNSADSHRPQSRAGAKNGSSFVLDQNSPLAQGSSRTSPVILPARAELSSKPREPVDKRFHGSLPRTIIRWPSKLQHGAVRTSPHTEPGSAQKKVLPKDPLRVTTTIVDKPTEEAILKAREPVLSPGALAQLKEFDDFLASLPPDPPPLSLQPAESIPPDQTHHTDIQLTASSSQRDNIGAAVPPVRDAPQTSAQPASPPQTQKSIGTVVPETEPGDVRSTQESQPQAAAMPSPAPSPVRPSIKSSMKSRSPSKKDMKKVDDAPSHNVAVLKKSLPFSSSMPDGPPRTNHQTDSNAPLSTSRADNPLPADDMNESEGETEHDDWVRRQQREKRRVFGPIPQISPSTFRPHLPPKKDVNDETEETIEQFSPVKSSETTKLKPVMALDKVVMPLSQDSDDLAAQIRRRGPELAQARKKQQRLELGYETAKKRSLDELLSRKGEGGGERGQSGDELQKHSNDSADATKPLSMNVDEEQEESYTLQYPLNDAGVPVVNGDSQEPPRNDDIHPLPAVGGADSDNTGQDAQTTRLLQEIASLKEQLATSKTISEELSLQRQIDNGELKHASAHVDELRQLNITLEEKLAVAMTTTPVVAAPDTARLEMLEQENQALTRSLAEAVAARQSAEKDSEFFRAQYSTASAYVTEVRQENTALLERAEIAERQARDGVALVKATYEKRLKDSEENAEKFGRIADFLMKKDARTDEIREQAAEAPELKEEVGRLKEEIVRLKTEVDAMAMDNEPLYLRIEALEAEKAEADMRWSAQVDRLQKDVEDGRRQLGELMADNSEAKSKRVGNTSTAVFRCEWRTDSEPCLGIFATRKEMEDHVLHGPHQFDLS